MLWREFIMSDFEIIVGISSIGSFIVAIIALFKVNKMEKQISIDQNNKTRQIIKKTKIENSNVNQIGRDNKGNR